MRGLRLYLYELNLQNFNFTVNFCENRLLFDKSILITITIKVYLIKFICLNVVQFVLTLSLFEKILTKWISTIQNDLALNSFENLSEFANVLSII